MKDISKSYAFMALYLQGVERYLLEKDYAENFEYSAQLSSLDAIEDAKLIRYACRIRQKIYRNYNSQYRQTTNFVEDAYPYMGKEIEYLKEHGIDLGSEFNLSFTVISVLNRLTKEINSRIRGVLTAMDFKYVNEVAMSYYAPEMTESDLVKYLKAVKPIIQKFPYITLISRYKRLGDRLHFLYQDDRSLIIGCHHLAGENYNLNGLNLEPFNWLKVNPDAPSKLPTGLEHLAELTGLAGLTETIQNAILKSTEPIEQADSPDTPATSSTPEPVQAQPTPTDEKGVLISKAELSALKKELKQYKDEKAQQDKQREHERKQQEAKELKKAKKEKQEKVKARMFKLPSDFPILSSSELHVDCDNVDYFTFLAMLEALKARATSGVKHTVSLYIDDETSPIWTLTNHIQNELFEFKQIRSERILENKSLVDLVMVAQIAKSASTPNANPQIIVSSDSDYMSLVKAGVPVANVFYEKSFVNAKYLDLLSEEGVQTTDISNIATPEFCDDQVGQIFVQLMLDHLPTIPMVKWTVANLSDYIIKDAKGYTKYEIKIVPHTVERIAETVLKNIEVTMKNGCATLSIKGVSNDICSNQTQPQSNLA